MSPSIVSAAPAGSAELTPGSCPEDPARTSEPHLGRDRSRLQTFALGWLLLLLAACLWYWIRLRPDIAGVDFFYYLLTARDRFLDAGGESGFYFPGVFEFWEASYRLADGDLSTIQWHYLAVVLANGLLIGAIIWRAFRLTSLALFGCVCYLILASGCEAAYGITEPIATLPLLCALLLLLPSLRLSVPRLAVLGLAIALAIFMKQQAALLSLGVLGLLMAELSLGPMSRVAVREAFFRGLFSAAIAVLVLVSLFYLVGSGPAGMVGGFSAVGDYPSEGTLFSNLKNFQTALDGFWTLFVVAAASLLLARGRYRHLSTHSLAWFCVFAALFAMLQFAKRHYLHYGLLPLPFMVIVVAVAIGTLDRARFAQSRAPMHAVNRAWPPIRDLLLAITATFFLAVPGTIIRDARPVAAAFMASSDSAQTICRYLEPGSAVLVYPMRFNQVHWLCGTLGARPGYRYTWIPLPEEQLRLILDSPDTAAVVLMKDDRQDLLEPVAQEGVSATSIATLLEPRHAKVIDVPAARIYRLQPPPGSRR